MHVSRSPTARWTSAAATAESTPPDRAQMTCPSEPVAAACRSTRSRMPATVVSMKLAGGPRLGDAGDATTKLRRMSRPRGVWTTSGWNWMPYRPPPGSARPANGGGVGLGGGLEAVGQPRDRVAVAHPHRLVAFDAAEQAVVVGDRDVCRAVLAAVGREDVAAELVGHQLGAVADAEDRDPPAPDRRVGFGASSS